MKRLPSHDRSPKRFDRARPASAGPTLSAAEALAKLSPARRVAFEILTLVLSGKGHSDEFLHDPAVDDLTEPDRHLATALVMGVLRWQIALDAQIRGLLQRPEQPLEEPVALALRLGAFQLLHLDRIPPHAALSESVELCRAAGHPHATGMVNAILRKIAAAPRPGTRVFESTGAFAERLGHPLWLVERWVANFGRAAALKICEADQEEPAPGRLFPEAEDGLPQMDDGSRLVAELAAVALPGTSQDGRAARVWDTCAAPGGKTLVLARRLAGAEVLATDVSPRRMAQMEARLRRFPYAANVRCQVADASRLPAGEGDFDLVLCDVPCSGTGTLARNPEIRLRLKPEELTRQAHRQNELLAAAMGRVRPGGRLLYSTCSLEPEENEAMVDTAAMSARGWERIPVDTLALDLPESGMVSSGALRTLPGVHRCDGFFAVVLQRKA